MKYNYRNNKTNKFITVLKRSESTPRYGFSFMGHGLDEIKTAYVKTELLKEALLYNNNKDYFDQYLSKIYISKDSKEYNIFMIPIEEFTKTELKEGEDYSAVTQDRYGYYISTLNLAIEMPIQAYNPIDINWDDAWNTVQWEAPEQTNNSI